MQGDPVRIFRHEIIPDCGSFEVWFEDGRPSVYRYWDDNPSRRLRPDTLTRADALNQVQEIARTALAELETKKAADRA